MVMVFVVVTFHNKYALKLLEERWKECGCKVSLHDIVSYANSYYKQLFDLFSSRIAPDDETIKEQINLIYNDNKTLFDRLSQA